MVNEPSFPNQKGNRRAEENESTDPLATASTSSSSSNKSKESKQENDAKERPAQASASITPLISPDNSKFVSGCPAEMAPVEDYCIDKFEAHLVTIEDGKEIQYPYFSTMDGKLVVAKSAPDVFPQAYISQVDSEAACRRAAKRLCTRAEWVKACRGPDNFTYPYGNARARKTCNTSRGDEIGELSGDDYLLRTFFGNDPMKWTYENFNDPRLDQFEGGLKQAGSYQGCKSPYGVFDMDGNLHEWVSDKVDSSFQGMPSKRAGWRGWQNKKTVSTIGNGIFLGAFFNDDEANGAGCHYMTVAHEPVYHDYSTGFRCCRDAEKK